MKSIVQAVQHRAAAALGVRESGRTATVAAMLENNYRRAPGYWIQLTLAMGIATVGLVLDSTAVVIGAMLVSPLMGPIIELGMGFAVGSAFLVLRAAFRVILSVLVVVGGAALLTLALPFHEITNEIAARTAPTALDLLVAVFCALTAAYTTVRPTSDTTSAAAGTAIGIALVPPLCVTGFGIGTGAPTVAGGASLLFIANLSAILVLAVLSFLILGYNQVEASAIERDYISPDLTRTGRLAVYAHETLGHVFGSRYGFAMRIIIPATFLAVVYVPLSRALDEVTWEVRARDAIRRILTELAPRAVQTAVEVERHTVNLRLVLVGSNERADALAANIKASVAASTGVVPAVSVTAVPDAETLAATTMGHATTARLHPVDAVDLTTLRRRMASTIDAEWPATIAGPIAGWRLIVPSRAAPTIVVHHLGDSLGRAAEVLLATRWSTQLGATVDVRDVPLAHAGVTERLGREREWLKAARPVLAWIADADRAVACVKAPVDSTRRSTALQRATLDSLRASTVNEAHRMTLADSSGWSVTAAIGQCQNANMNDLKSGAPR